MGDDDLQTKLAQTADNQFLQKYRIFELTLISFKIQAKRCTKCVATVTTM